MFQLLASTLGCRALGGLLFTLIDRHFMMVFFGHLEVEGSCFRASGSQAVGFRI